MATPQIDWQGLLNAVPGVRQEFQEESSRDGKSKQNLLDLGILNDEDYAKYWYNSMGGSGLINAPTVAPVTTPNPTPSTIPGDTPAARNSAMYQAINRAKLGVQSRGLNWDDYDDDILSSIGGIYDTISDSDKNPSGYFDPNLADSVLNGKQNQARMQYRGQVNSKLGTPGVDYTQLDATISKLLGESEAEANSLIERGQKRGQFNEVGAQAGMGKLAQAKTKARARLMSEAEGLYSKYSGEFNSIKDSALSAANNYTLGDTFDIGQYGSQYDRLQKSVGSRIEGDLYDLIGDDPLINFNDIRGSIGQGQGAVNLRDLDVMDGLEKRKNMSSAGRGLGSQGAF